MYVLLVMFLLNTSHGKYLEPRHSNYLLPFPGCPEHFFRCENENCLDLSFVCNGIDDCQDDSDEDNCETDLELNTPASKTFTQIGSALNNIKKEIILIKDFFETDYSTDYSDDDGPNMEGSGAGEMEEGSGEGSRMFRNNSGPQWFQDEIIATIEMVEEFKIDNVAWLQDDIKGGPNKNIWL